MRFVLLWLIISQCDLQAFCQASWSQSLRFRLFSVEGKFVTPEKIDSGFYRIYSLGQARGSSRIEFFEYDSALRLYVFTEHTISPHFDLLVEHEGHFMRVAISTWDFSLGSEGAKKKIDSLHFIVNDTAKALTAPLDIPFTGNNPVVRSFPAPEIIQHLDCRVFFTNKGRERRLKFKLYGEQRAVKAADLLNGSWTVSVIPLDFPGESKKRIHQLTEFSFNEKNDFFSYVDWCNSFYADLVIQHNKEIMIVKFRGNLQVDAIHFSDGVYFMGHENYHNSTDVFRVAPMYIPDAATYLSNNEIYYGHDWSKKRLIAAVTASD